MACSLPTQCNEPEEDIVERDGASKPREQELLEEKTRVTPSETFSEEDPLERKTTIKTRTAEGPLEERTGIISTNSTFKVLGRKAHLEMNPKKNMGYSWEIIIITNNKHRNQIKRLLCTCCKLILRDAVQTVEGLRLCLCCAKHIIKCVYICRELGSTVYQLVL